MNRVAAWRRLIETNTADAACDLLIRYRHEKGPAPYPLIEAVAVAPVVAEREIRALARKELTDRQRQVLAGIANGLHDAEIAAQLHVGEQTVKGHVKGILSKLGARNRTHAVALAFARGVLTATDG